MVTFLYEVLLLCGDISDLSFNLMWMKTNLVRFLTEKKLKALAGILNRIAVNGLSVLDFKTK